MRLSIIIPVLNDAPALEVTLAGLTSLRERGHEVIVVDGGSRDATASVAQAGADKLIQSVKGRAMQMNAGAAQARGDILLFLHADTQLPDLTETIFTCLAQQPRFWGRFDVRLSGRQWLLRVVETLMNWRSRLSGIATGDQAIFVSRGLFTEVGGFPELQLMEDIAMSKSLRQHLPPLCLRARVQTSSRRWEEHGILSTILFMWWLRLLFFVGVSPDKLAKYYYS